MAWKLNKAQAKQVATAAHALTAAHEQLAAAIDAFNDAAQALDEYRDVLELLTQRAPAKLKALMRDEAGDDVADSLVAALDRDVFALELAQSHRREWANMPQATRTALEQRAAKVTMRKAARIKRLLPAVKQHVGAFFDAVSAAESVREEIAEGLQERFDEMSEKWQESDVASEVGDWIERWNEEAPEWDFELDEETQRLPDLPEPEEYAVIGVDAASDG